MSKFTISNPDPATRGCPDSAPSLTQHDLCAQLTPLNRYGLADFSSALADGLRALARQALRVLGAGARD